ncbi:MAG: hypothetical protein L0228_01720 [Planctomycetes bacterium]|nr:hypothetical protein [Planctomycetota bacterium]
MGILIGMDEAGYGPNLGPLVVAATAWEVAEEVSGVRCPVSGNSQNNGLPIGKTGLKSAIRKEFTRRGGQSEIECDLYRSLRNIVSKSASERRVAISDSKSLYHPGLGLRQLERGVHTVLLAVQEQVNCWSAMVHCCGADPDGHHRRACWPDGFDCPLPIDASADELVRLSARLARACDAAGVRPILIRARLVFPAEFNELTARYGTKGAALSHITVGLLRQVTDATRMLGETSLTSALSSLTPDTRHLSPVIAVCDKHGGRNYYTSLLQHHFSEHWIEPVFESAADSRYEWGPPESRVRVAFRMKGESFLPTALASMTAKYLRELAMRAFNAFWAAHVPDLRPTAGYPSDSHRFRRAIAAAQRQLGIDDHLLWRNR